MSRGLNPTAARRWIGAIVAVYFVLLFPACWSGAQIRAQQQGLVGPSSSNNNEEREEHEQHEVVVRDAQGQRPPRPSHRALRVVERTRIAYVPQLVDSVATLPVPSVLSVRRLL